MTERTAGRDQIVQIDLLKALAVLAVIVMHAMTTEALEGPWGAFHVWQAVPVFVVLLGLNAGMSAARRAPDGFDLPVYYRARARRLLPIFLVVAASVLAGLLISRAEFGPINFAGRLPLTGPGNYFMVIVIEFVLVFPLLWWLWCKSPVGTLVGVTLFELGWHLLFMAADVLEGAGTGDWWFIYTSSLPHWIGGIALGLWLASAPDLLARRNRWIIAAAALSMVYLGVFSASSSETTLLPDQQNLLAWPYAALLILAGIRWLPTTGLLVRGLAVTGQASLHIFLVQMLWYGQAVHYVPEAFPTPWWMSVPPALVVTVCAGVLWWWLDTQRPLARLRAARGGRAPAQALGAPEADFSKTQ